MAHDDDEKMEALWDITLNGFEDESIGSVDELGWYGVVTDEDGARWIVSEDSQGFHYRYEYTDEFWQRIQDAYSEWDAQGDGGEA